MMDKRGQGGLSMNTIVVAIVAIIVLLLIVTFFTGGLGTIGQKITSIFQGGTAGYDLDLAVQNCEDFCARAQQLEETGVSNAIIGESAYCTQTFDTDGSGDERDCESLGVSCSGIADLVECNP
jgi:hypothetical protein